MPGAEQPRCRRARRRRRVPSGNTVSRCAQTTTGASSLAPAPRARSRCRRRRCARRRGRAPGSAPRRTRRARCSAPVGAGISESATWCRSTAIVGGGERASRAARVRSQRESASGEAITSRGARSRYRGRCRIAAYRWPVARSTQPQCTAGRSASARPAMRHAPTDHRRPAARTQRLRARRGELPHRRVERDDLSAPAGVPHRPCSARTRASSARSRARRRRRRRCSSWRAAGGRTACGGGSRSSCSGYGIASVVRPLVAIAQSATQVLVIRVADRVGKGIRNAPRDALIAESVDPSIRGRAFGFHRAADNAGGVARPAHRVRRADVALRRAAHRVLAGGDPRACCRARRADRVRARRPARRSRRRRTRGGAGPRAAARRALLARCSA